MKWEEKGAVAKLCNNLTVYSPPPPTSGAVLAGILQIMCNFNLTPEDARDVRTSQRFVEALKHSYAKRTMIGDWNDPEHKQDVEEVVITSESWYH